MRDGARPAGSLGTAELPPTGRVLGVDAAGKLGWVAVLLDENGFLGLQHGSLQGVIEWAELLDVIGVDIPIGNIPGGSRRADIEARGFVGPRASSVFATPPNEVLTAVSYIKANEMLEASGGPKLSQQAWALVPKIVEAATVAERNEARLRGSS